MLTIAVVAESVEEWQKTCGIDYDALTDGILPRDRMNHPKLKHVVDWYRENEEDWVANELQEGRVVRPMKTTMEYLTRLVSPSICI